MIDKIKDFLSENDDYIILGALGIAALDILEYLPGNVDILGFDIKWFYLIIIGYATYKFYNDYRDLSEKVNVHRTVPERRLGSPKFRKGLEKSYKGVTPRSSNQGLGGSESVQENRTIQPSDELWETFDRK